MANEDETLPPLAPTVTMMTTFKPERFDVEDPTNWFISFEANLRINQVPDDRRYDYLLCALHAAARAPITHHLSSPPEETEKRYPWLKEILISGHTKSRRQKLQQLLQGERIGDRKPTAFLAHLRELAPDTVDDELVREFWWKELSSTARAILSACDTRDVRQLADAADAVYEELNEKLRVEAIRKPTANQTPQPPKDDRIESLIAAIQKLLTELRQDRAPRERSRSRSRGNATQRPKSPAQPQGELCFYHSRFGEAARACRDPCGWPKN